MGELQQLPGLAIQRLMEKGYGFGAEGDWKTAAMVNQFQYDRLTGLYSKEFFYRKAKDLLAQNPQNAMM